MCRTRVPGSTHLEWNLPPPALLKGCAYKGKPMPDTVSDHVVNTLIEWGVDTVFGLPGDGINGLVEAFRKAKDKIRYVHVRHEETAALAACAYAKFSGRLGVASPPPRPAPFISSTACTTPRSTARRSSPSLA